MTLLLFVEQVLNGLQLGVMLFLMAAGRTLVFGIMGLINLAHGSLYMIGAYVAATVQQATGSFLVGLLVALPVAALVGMAVEMIALRRLYPRDHLDQVLATFGLILFFNELVKIVWGPQAYFMAMPDLLSGSVDIIPGIPYPAYRLAIVAAGLAVAILLYLLITRTRIGMLIRAGATNREMVNALGVNVDRLYTIV
ncbi:MAG: branched-chain amino acid ABC transporter permease, partial [Alphaproteobacteria bacterium]|nr:branched-chain amino acid ABC transporter permease [Alphaproteobacteria bacterium]